MHFSWVSFQLVRNYRYDETFNIQKKIFSHQSNWNFIFIILFVRLLFFESEVMMENSFLFIFFIDRNLIWYKEDDYSPFLEVFIILYWIKLLIKLYFDTSNKIYECTDWEFYWIVMHFIITHFCWHTHGINQIYWIFLSLFL